MPLRCVEPSGESIHSFDLSDDEWQALALKNKEARHLRMPCCSAHVALKRSRLATPFFAHIARRECKSTSETDEHRYLKWLAVMAARSHGWTAETEAMETTPSGEPWRADVLARKGKYKVAIEVQWSRQA